jgi:hypothetical protein
MANLSGFNPLLLGGNFQYLTPYLTRIGVQEGEAKLVSGDTHVRHEALKHAIDGRKEIAVKDLLSSAIAKSAPFTALVKEMATFSTNNADPLNPASAVRYSTDVKTAEAIVKKAKRKYHGDILQVKDILRGQITFPDESSLVCAVASMNTLCETGASETDGFKIVRVKNLFIFHPGQAPVSECLPTGYKHMLITLKFSDGFLAGKFCRPISNAVQTHSG